MFSRTGDQDGQFGTHRQRLERTHRGPARIAQWQPSTQVSQRHQGQPENLACRFGPVSVRSDSPNISA